MSAGAFPGPLGRLPSMEVSRGESPHVIYQRMLEESYREAGINQAIEYLHGGLLSRAEQRGRNMSFERWQHIQEDPSAAERILGEVVQSAFDEIRDRLLDHMLGELPGRLLGAPLTYATGLQMIYEESRWNQRDAANRLAYRTQRIYAFLLGVMATNMASGDVSRAAEINQILVAQALRYQRWRREYYPVLQLWVYDHTTATERGPQLSLPSPGVRRAY